MAVSIVGQEEARRIVISSHHGLYTIIAPHKGVEKVYQGASLESALGKASEGAPESWIHHAAEIFEGLLRRAE
jgi:hypothetical protein